MSSTFRTSSIIDSVIRLLLFVRSVWIMFSKRPIRSLSFFRFAVPIRDGISSCLAHFEPLRMQALHFEGLSGDERHFTFAVDLGDYTC
jgi:hypothetical protein